MRAQNHKEITHGYLKFSGFLALCIVIAVLINLCYTKTSDVEVDRIIDKTEEYDKIYVRQIDLSNRIDTLYQYTSMFNTNLNDAHLLHSVSRRKQEILSMMDDMSSRDVRLYQKLMTEINVFLSVKDSIRIAKSTEDLIKSDLLICTEENKLISRKLTIGSITLNK